MDRLQVSANVPAEIAERESDVGAELSAEDEAAIYAAAEQAIRNPDWWNSTLEGVNSVTNELPAVLARCMANLDAACAGDQHARDAITSALHIIQKRARLDAHDEQTEKFYA